MFTLCRNVPGVATNAPAALDATLLAAHAEYENVFVAGSPTAPAGWCGGDPGHCGRYGYGAEAWLGLGLGLCGGLNGALGAGSGTWAAAKEKADVPGPLIVTWGGMGSCRPW